jgi:F-type H+-transporting ATPase subunit delta
MKETAAAQRYSQALFLAVAGQGQPPAEIQKQLQKSAQLIRTDARLAETLAHAFLPFEQKRAALFEVLERERVGASALLLNFFKLLLEKKRIGLLPLIAAQFDQAVDGSLGRIRASVKSATPMDEPAREKMRKNLSAMLGKEAVIDWTVDSDLLAGVVVRAGDRVLDNSLKSQLKNLKTHLEQSSR